MTFRFYSRLGLLPKRQLFPLPRYASQPRLRNASVNTKQRAPNYEPTPSQLLRFALTGATQPLGQDGSNQFLDEYLKEIFLGEWPLHASPRPLWSSFQTNAARPDKSVLRKGLGSGVRSIRHLQSLIEGQVNEAYGSELLQRERCKPLSQALEHCQRHSSYGDIITLMNGIVTRLERLRVPVSIHLYTLGMYYSCLSFSAPALKRHLEGYLALSSERLDLEPSVSLVDALHSSLQYLEFEGLDQNTDPMLNQVTGESNFGHASQSSLHNILCWSDPEHSTELVERYFLLLAKLRSHRILQGVWDQVLRGLSVDSSIQEFKRAYACVMALISAGDSERAITYLKQVSERANGALPHISKFYDLSAMLANESVSDVLPQLAGQDEFANVLDVQLKYMERRLGIKWQPDKSVHTSVSESLCISTGQHFLTMDGDSAGYGSSDRLIVEIQALGCSKSTADLGRIASLLDDHEGDQIPVVLSSSETVPFDLTWVPQRSSIEFSGSFLSMKTDTSLPWSPSTLGLVRIKLASNETPITNESTLHLMQLGYLLMRPTATSQAQSENIPQWKESGHIVALDRASGQLLIVFVGKAHGSIDPGVQPHLPQPPAGLHAIMRIEPQGDATLDDFSKRGHESFIPLFANSSTNCHFEVDPSPDLVP